MIGDRVVAAMRRTAQGDEFRSNVHRGGLVEAVSLDPIYERTAVRAAQIMGLRIAKYGIDPRRFRGNLWVDGLAPWEEFGWVDETIIIGDVRFRVEERIERCLATTANPDTGRRDADTLGGLEAGWGHRHMGVYLVALVDGRIETGQPVRLA